MAKYLVIDNGGTFIKPALFDGEGNLIEILEKIPTKTFDMTGLGGSLAGEEITNEEMAASLKGPMNSVEGYLEALDPVVKPLVGEIDGIAMSFPGVNDSDKGFCYSGGAFFFADHINLADIMTEHYGVKVTLENDGKCAALAELWKGSLQDVQNGAVLALGTGMAGGVIINGEILKGRRFSAGEFSYMMNDISGKADNFFSASFTSNSAMGICMKVAYAKGLDPQTVDGFKVFELAKEGDPVVLGILDMNCTEIIGQIYNMTAMLDLDCVAIGGGISKEPMMIKMLQDKAEALNAKNEEMIGKLTSFFPRVHVRPCTFYNEANMVGALYHHLKLRGLPI